MNHTEGHFPGSRGRQIYFQVWSPASAPRGVILLVHGAGEHSARYQHVAAFFTANGYVFAGLDHNGHGRSDGVPGHLVDFEDYSADLRLLQDRVVSEYGGLPLFLLGHSLGGLITCNYLLQHQAEFSGAILSGPAIKAEVEPPPYQMLLIRLLSTLAPKVGVLQLDAAGVSRDPAVVEDYVQDPLVHHGKMSARKIHGLFNTMHKVQDRAGEIQLPMLVMHGQEDSMAAPSGSVVLDQRLGSADKTLVLYPGLYHEILNEPEQQEVMDTMLQWFDAHLPTAG